MDALLVSNIRRDCGNLVVGKSLYRRHISEVPVVLADSVAYGQRKGRVAVVVRFVHDRQVTWASSGTAKVRAVTCCTMLLIERFACGRIDLAGAICC